MNDSIRVIGQFLWLEAIHVQKFARNLNHVDITQSQKLTTVEPPLTATSLQWPFLFGGSPYIDSRLNLSTTATIFCPQGGRCGGVQI